MALSGFSTSNYLEATHTYGSSPISLSCWGKTPTSSTSQALIGNFKAGNPYNFIYLDSTNKAGFEFNDDTSSAHALTSTTFTASAWQHYAGWEASATSRAAYLNAAGKGTNATNLAGAGGTTRITIGIWHQNASIFLPWLGDLDEAAIYDIALADADVTALFSGGAGGIGQDARFVQNAHLIAYWKFDASGGQLTDLIGGVTLSVVGSLSNVAGPTISSWPGTVLTPTYYREHVARMGG